MQLIASLATLAAVSTTVNAMGSAIINNNCDFNVYMWPIDAQRNPSEPTVISPGGSWSEVYHTLSSGGVSLKMSKTTQRQKITQFEYTVQSYSGENFIWYDGSNVDCVDADCPFWDNGISLKTSNPSCPTRDCLVGAVCSGFYTLWNDDHNSLSCDQDADVIMTLCSVNTGSGSATSQKQVVKESKPDTPSPSPSPSKKVDIINEAVATTFVTEFATKPTKRAEAEPVEKRDVHHNHMHFHQRRAAAAAAAAEEA